MIKPETSNLLNDSMFMKACRCEPTDYTPIWLMRQAGRYMKEYRAIREKVPFLDLCQNAQLAAEVMITAVERIGVDAAIIFSDILLILQPMGMDLEYIKDEGPVLHNPIRTFDQIRNLREVEPEESLSFVFDVVRSTRAMLRPNIPLIGFAGAPFTLAAYLVEGAGSREFSVLKRALYREEAMMRALLDHLAEGVIAYLAAQVEAGAQALQLFDTWAGLLSRADYEYWIQPLHRRIAEGLRETGVPLILYVNQGSHVTDFMANTGFDVVSLDWRADLGQAASEIGGTG